MRSFKIVTGTVFFILMGVLLTGARSPESALPMQSECNPDACERCIKDKRERNRKCIQECRDRDGENCYQECRDDSRCPDCKDCVGSAR